MSWATPEVLRVAAQWQWTPYDAQLSADDSVEVVVSDGRATVSRAIGDSAPDLVDRVCRAAAAVDPNSTVYWPTHQAIEPADLVATLEAAGARVAEELEVMAREFAAGPGNLDLPDDVDVKSIDDAALLPDAHRVSIQVFDFPLPTADFVTKEIAELDKQVAAGAHRTIYRYVAYVDGQLAGAAGFTLDEGVAKMWGGGVIEKFRGRGVYRALLAARWRDAARARAELALVKARTGSSGPILQHFGFQVCGREYVYQLPAGV